MVNLHYVKSSSNVGGDNIERTRNQTSCCQRDNNECAFELQIHLCQIALLSR